MGRAFINRTLSDGDIDKLKELHAKINPKVPPPDFESKNTELMIVRDEDDPARIVENEVHHFDGAFDGPVDGHYDENDVRELFLHLCEKFHAGHLGHLEVGDDYIGPVLVEKVERLMPVGGGEDLVALHFQDAAQHFALDPFVVNYEQSCLEHLLSRIWGL